MVAVSHDSLTLTWTPPETTAFDIVDYEVQYRVSGDSGFLNWDHNGTATRTTITGLVDVTRYEVRVRAVDELDTGDWSAAAIGATAAAAPRFVDGVCGRGRESRGVNRKPRRWRTVWQTGLKTRTCARDVSKRRI